ncbi:MAG: sugar ABC transporter ATP-binding protein [Oscillospiraceae bacterium]|nr:sugar ABC transporter ATP-binding protein [Oscillospiraceae bacterium]
MEEIEKARSEPEIILKLEHITKEFPGVKALNDVCFDLRRGEIHALVGENGAGKSTLLKILSGVHLTYEGNIILEGKTVRFKNPIDAQEQGICMEYQEKTSFPNLTVGENICIGHWDKYRKGGLKGLVSWRGIHKEARRIISELKFDINTHDRMCDITPEKQQIVQIAHAIAIEGKILILDEPTAAISYSEVDNLFAILNMLKEQGYSIIYVSHHLKEIFRISDRMTILKDGCTVGTYNTAEMDENRVTELMVGRKIERSARIGIELPDENVFEIQNITTKDGLLKNISLRVRKGEIVGVAGLLGSGKELLYRAVCGMSPLGSGQMTLEGKPYVPRSPKRAIAAGITALPAERSIEGLILKQSIGFNITLSSYSKFSRGSVMSAKKQNDLALSSAQNVHLKYAALSDPVNSLSGGNQQRVMIGRAFSTDAKLIIFNEPTQGVDVGAKWEIHKLIQSYAADGGAVLMVSSELPELLTNCDRILVMANGEINAEFAIADATEELLLKYMIG